MVGRFDLGSPPIAENLISSHAGTGFFGILVIHILYSVIADINFARRESCHFKVLRQ